MSQHAHQHPEQIGSDPRLHVPGIGAPAPRGDDGCYGPEPPARKLTDSRLNPWGGHWTIEDALIEKRERETEAALASWDDRVDAIAKELLDKHFPEAR